MIKRKNKINTIYNNIFIKYTKQSLFIIRLLHTKKTIRNDTNSNHRVESGVYKDLGTIKYLIRFYLSICIFLFIMFMIPQIYYYFYQ